MPYTFTPPAGGPGVNYDDPNYFSNAVTYFNSFATKAASDRADIGSIIDTLQTAYDIRAISAVVNGDKLIRYMGKPAILQLAFILTSKVSPTARC